jgi:E3 ubiquitin-protein ligase UBR1
MVAQIRTGLWVRNGFPIRGQLLHYRDYMLRELCYDQDLLILQTCLVVLDPNVVLVSALDRFQLLRWFSGDTNPSAYDEAQSYSMAEEFLYVIITSVSEFGTAKGLTMDELVRREIVHGLALGPCSYTELCKRVPERVTEEASFDRVLGSISTFKAPESISDSGTYSLKDEVFDEVNPFFFHYTRNRREEIEGILKLRLQKKTGVENPVVTPRPLGVSSGPFATLSLVFHSEVLLQILFYALWNVYTEVELHKNMPSGGDAILDQTLHLLMLAIVEHPQSFPRFAAVIRLRDGAPKSIIRTLCMMETHDKLKSFKPKVAWILDHMAEQIPSEILQWRISGVSNAKAAQSDDAKKRAAKARQDAIMKQFAVAQKTFLDTFEADDIDDDGMDATTEQENVSLGVCIVCQENLDQSRAFGALALLQPSRFIRQTPDGRADYASDILLSPVSLDRQLPPPHLGPQAAPSFHGFPHDHTRFGVHSSLCGHLMHLDCFSVYMHSVEQRHVQQTSRNHPESVERSEFICPLCKSLGNVILPVPEEPRLRVPPPSHLGDWMRSVGIELLRSTPDRMVESLQYSSGSGQFVFWGAEDSGYSPYDGQAHIDDSHRMVERLRSVVYATSSQSRHRRDRPEPDSPQRGAGMYLPDDIVAYTVSSIEIAQRGNGAPGTSVINGLSDQSLRLLRGLLACLGKLAALQFPERRDSGSESMRQAILKRVLPEWTRDAGLRKPLLLRDPLGILAEAACVAPDILPQLTVLMYYACLARTAIALVNYMAHLRPTSALPVIPERDHPKIFGDVRTFVLSVARHSRTLEQTAEQTLRSPLSEARLEKLLYSHTLPFLRQAAILRQAVSPLSPSSMSDDSCEYVRLLNVLDIPFPSELAKHESLQNVLAGWSSHYGLLHVLSPLESIISMDYPNVYQLVQLPYALDSFFTDDAPLKCQRCETIPQDPAICMICGTICCSQSHCCTDGDHREEGECNMHTRE